MNWSASRSSTQPHRQGRPRLMTPRRASCRASAVVVVWRPPRQLRQLTRAPIRTPLSQQLQTQLALTRIDAPRRRWITPCQLGGLRRGCPIGQAMLHSEFESVSVEVLN